MDNSTGTVSEGEGYPANDESGAPPQQMPCDEPLTHEERPRGSSTRVYDPLNASECEIRLLQIHPSVEVEAEIQCSLHTVRLGEEPRCVALSYEWAYLIPYQTSSTECYHIYVNDQHMRVTENLWVALVCLRAEITSSKPRFWVDAICINQGDDVERAQQVALMGLVFGQAVSVWAWLGMNEEDSTLAMDLIHEAESHRRQVGALNPWLRHKLADPQYEEHWIALRRLLQRSFWRRGWITQEIMLAREPIIMCGPYKAKLSSLISLVDALNIYVAEEDMGCERFAMDCYVSAEYILKSYLFFSSDQEHADDGRDLLELLKVLNFTITSDPRHKIFSLLGLANPYPGVELLVDYSIPWQQVFKNAAIYIIEGTQSLEILAEGGLETQDLPSWVPLWTDRSAKSVIANSDVFSAGGSTYSLAAFSEDKSRLVVNMIMAGTVQEITSTPPPTAERSPLATVAELTRLLSFVVSDCQSLLESTTRFSAQLIVGMAILSVYNTIFTNAAFTDAHTTWRPADFVDFCFACIDGEASPTNLIPAQHELLWRALFGKRFFKCRLHDDLERIKDFGAELIPESLKTSSSHDDLQTTLSQLPPWRVLGLGRPQVCVGDSVTVISGCERPLILRQVIGSDHYRVICKRV